MDTIFSAILGELTSRSLSFFIDRCSSKPLLPQPPAVSKEEKIKRLERMLLRLAATVEEAEGRRVANHAMLRQVNILRQDMYKGYYLLDTFRFQKAHEENVTNKDNNEVSYSLALSKFNSTKRARVPSGSRSHGDKEELEKMVDNLEITMADMVEFVLLLNNYPSIQRQPYNTYMFMDKCVFGRQMEMEHIINFLLQPEPPNTSNVDHNLGVLPIIGPSKVGKSTLVEHVCYDERVRNHFSHIIFLTDNDFREDKSLLILCDSGVIKHKTSSSSSSASSGAERLLVVAELTGDVSDDEWRRMYSSCRSRISAGSKIIITSQSEKIAKLGTTQPLRLKFLSQEAYWYFFRVLAFGSSDPEEHPEVASLSTAMFNGYFDHKLYKSFIGPFIDLSNMASLIQASVYNGSYLSLRERLRDTETKSHLLLKRDPGDSGVESKCVFIPKTDGTVHYYCKIYNHCRVGHAHEEEEEAPKIGMQDLLSGRAAPNGKFDLVLWRSHLPPYYSYIYSSEIHEYKSAAIFRMGLRRKRKTLL